MQSFSPKTPAEVVLLSFDFASRLAPSETIQTATVSVLFAYGPTQPTTQQLTDMLAGNVTTSGKVIARLIGGGIEGNTYEVLARVTTSTGQVLDEQGSLTVTSIQQ